MHLLERCIGPLHCVNDASAYTLVQSESVLQVYVSMQPCYAHSLMPVKMSLSRPLRRDFSSPINTLVKVKRLSLGGI